MNTKVNLGALVFTPFQIDVLKTLVRYHNAHSYGATADEIRITMKLKSHLPVANSLRAILNKSTGIMNDDIYGSNNGLICTLHPKDQWEARRWLIKDIVAVTQILNKQ